MLYLFILFFVLVQSTRFTLHCVHVYDMLIFFLLHFLYQSIDYPVHLNASICFSNVTYVHWILYMDLIFCHTYICSQPVEELFEPETLLIIYYIKLRSILYNDHCWSYYSKQYTPSSSQTKWGSICGLFLDVGGIVVNLERAPSTISPRWSCAVCILAYEVMYQRWKGEEQTSATARLDCLWAVYCFVEKL